MTVDASPTLPANDAEPDAPVAQEDRYTNRELSWLSFNRRVLAESENESYPLLERLRFLSISASNLDEFTMVRIAGLEGQVQRGIETQAIDGASPRQQLAAIREQLLQLEDRQQASLDTLSALLAEEGIILAPVEALSDEQQGWLTAYFESDILPLITPQAIDPSHPFPFVANKGIGVIFRLKRGKRQADLIEMVLIPSGAPRFVRVPGEQAIYVAIEQLVTRFADQLFPGFKVLGDGVFRVLRDSDIEVEEEAEDLVRYFRTAIQRRRRGHVVLLELDEDCDGIAETLLREQLEVDEDMIVKSGGMLGLRNLDAICDEPRPDLKFSPFSPRYPERILEHDGDCFSAIREKDLVIHHPFES
ncbi:MAG: RNA degradosome polyphosphate kinase, partial [Pseudomonadota bacterium]|nr:RNA degradosome polyphosphate kinase [Pseudomonadota bacterium]